MKRFNVSNYIFLPKSQPWTKGLVGLGNLRPNERSKWITAAPLGFWTEGWGRGDVPVVVVQRGGLRFTFGHTLRCTRLGGLDSSQPCPSAGVKNGEEG